MKFIEKLERLMDERDIKNNMELSRLSGIPYTTIDGLFKKDGDPKLKTLMALQRFFGCSLSYLADDDIEERYEINTSGAYDLGEILKSTAVITVDGSELTAEEIEEIKKYIRYAVVVKREMGKSGE